VTAPHDSGPGDRAREWVAAHTARLQELETAANRAGWEAATTGTDEALRASADARSAVRRLYSDAGEAARVRRFLEADEPADPLLHRQLVLTDLRFRENQVPPEVIQDLTERESELERIFYTFRPDFEGRAASNNELLEVLRSEKDPGRRRAAWEASKRIGDPVAPRLRELVRRRNASARSLGYETYYSMQLELEEIDGAALFRTLDDFRSRSDSHFAAMRGEIDALLAQRFDISPDEVYPWHWEDFFGQEAPGVGDVDLDPFFRGRELEPIAEEYFRAIGLPIEDVIARSDLYERPAKDQHAFCIDLDRAGDVRILCNLRDTERWMGTLLHELGHAAYNKYTPLSLPYVLRGPGHILLTEAIAMYMGRLTRDPVWLREELGAELDETRARDIERQLGWAMLVAARWILVMVYFERELYRDPDRDDLNTLWWDLVESIQLVRRPPGRDEPDWASKLHLSLAPVYYHNYLLGEFTASQLSASIRGDERELRSRRDPRIGRFFRERVFSRGASLPWNALLAEATGSELSSRFFVEDFVRPAGR
jgi:peptidyl-dipeptidase A